jgi:type II secretory pathway component PulF
VLHVIAPSLQDRVCEMHQLQAHLHQHPEMSPKTICDVLVQAEMLGLLRVLAKKIKKNLNVKVIQR